MKKYRGVVVLLMIVGITVFAGGWWGQKFITGLLFSDVSGKYQEYVNMSGGYKVLIPREWNPEEVQVAGKFTSRVVISPKSGGYRAGNISQLSITLVDNAGATQVLSTQAEFDQWQMKENQEIRGVGIIKLGNEKINGWPAVRLAEVGMAEDYPEKSFWSVTSWFRREGKNGYINMMGNGRLTEAEMGIFSRILRSYSENQAIIKFGD